MELNEVRMCVCVMTDVTAEDSGNYTCELRGSKSAVLASVTHFVFVRGTPHRISSHHRQHQLETGLQAN